MAERLNDPLPAPAAGVEPPASVADKLVLALAMLVPSVVTWIYFIWLANRQSEGQQLAFAVGKALQFALPVVWVAFAQPSRLGRPRVQGTTGRYALLGIAFGVAVVLAMVALYHVVLKPYGWIAEAAPQILGKVRSFGVASLLSYLGLAAFYALIHSGLEEYYWRWFVYGQLRRLMPVVAAAVVSSVAFMAHHVILLGFYFGWTTPWTYLFSVAVAIGGLVWAWLYQRSGSIVAAWLSHLVVDAGIFLVGYDVVRGLLR